MLTTSEDRQEAAVVKQLASLAPREHPGSSPESGNVDRVARTEAHGVRGSTARKLLVWLLGGPAVLLLLSGKPRKAFAVAAVAGTVGLLILGA